MISEGCAQRARGDAFGLRQVLVWIWADILFDLLDEFSLDATRIFSPGTISLMRQPQKFVCLCPIMDFVQFHRKFVLWKVAVLGMLRSLSLFLSEVKS